MAHSNASPYPLPFPSEVQRAQISSYSSLANALGAVPGQAIRQKQRSTLTIRDAAIDNQAIHLDRLPVISPSYPYPVRNILSPDMCHARTPLSVSNGYCLGDASFAWDENSHQKDLRKFPSRYDRLPQPSVGQDELYGYQSGPEFPTIHFLRKEDKAPYSIWDLLTMDTMPDLVDGDSPILAQNPDRRIKIKLMWPGYSHYPFEKRITIKRGDPWKSALLLMTLAHHIEEFVKWVRNEEAIVEPGQERWAITGMLGGAPAMWKHCIITSVRHQAGSVWQPEIYCPRG